MVKTELIRIQAFQQVAVLVAEAGETAGNTPGVGIVDDGIDDILYIPLAQGEQIDTTLVVLGEEYQIVPQKRCSLTAPQIEVGEIIFASTLAAV